MLFQQWGFMTEPHRFLPVRLLNRKTHSNQAIRVTKTIRQEVTPDGTGHRKTQVPLARDMGRSQVALF